MRILLAAPRGFCAGVRMAAASLERALELVGAPVYVYHEIVHNNWIVEDFRRRGVVFVDDLAEVPDGSFLMFSAHGVAPAIRQLAKKRGMRTIDATCPLVQKVHDETERYSQNGYTVFLIGHAGHDEVVGTQGVADNIQLVQCEDDVAGLEPLDESKTAYVMQTTLSVDDANRIVQRLRERFPEIVGPAKDDICYATQNRQQAVKDWVAEADVALVVGSPTSSNCKRLTEVAERHGCTAYLIDGPAEMQPVWFDQAETVLVTAGASVPEHLVQQCVQWLSDNFTATVEERSLTRERASFPLPAELRTLEESAPQA